MQSLATSETLHKYWESRAKDRVFYRGEFFYTVTSLPFYVVRRKLLLANIRSVIHEFLEYTSTAEVLDLGCGDGYYSVYLKKYFPNFHVFACDLSSSMIEAAKARAKSEGCEVVFRVSDSVIPFDKKFDVILIITVLAHVLDGELLRSMIQDLSDHLASNGSLILFEATATVPRKGKTWYRRSEKELENLFDNARFSLRSKSTISFPFFTLTDKVIRKVFRLFLRLACRNAERRIKNLNHVWPYIWIS